MHDHDDRGYIEFQACQRAITSEAVTCRLQVQTANQRSIACGRMTSKIGANCDSVLC